MGRLVQFLGVIGNDIALLRRQLSRLERQADQPFTHSHEIFDFGPHCLRQCTGPGLLTVLGTLLVFSLTVIVNPPLLSGCLAWPGELPGGLVSSFSLS